MDRPGAEAFVRHWWATFNYANDTGDTAPLDAISLPDCGTCKEAAQAARTAYQGGGEMRGGDVTVTSAVAASIRETGLVLVTTTISQDAATLHDGQGKVVSTHPALEETTLSFYAQSDEQGWTTRAIAPVEGK